MSAPPGTGSGLAGLLWRFTPALFACALLAAATPVPARAAGETATIGFDDLAAETVVGNQYGGEGLELGTAVGFGRKELSAGDCGSPTVKEGTAVSPPKYALLAACAVKGDPAAPLWSGTYGKLLGQPRGSVSVEMRDLAPAPAPRAALLTGYDSAGNVVGNQEKTLAVGAWTQIAIALPGGAKTISYFSFAA